MAKTAERVDPEAAEVVRVRRTGKRPPTVIIDEGITVGGQD
ncbi:hypothetical protein SAMN05216330_1143 [Bradyrhizobium sp. Ghvi]|nr:hypothetical protein [Bradyrhizobium sp. Ghvi]SFQ03590.1 hypothetical protein SAMN05216330_1143 [Bradyrhizobium sp. Ghvi]